ncbi:hypothetical protein BP6252_13691 [Coleophoma cylindrospora]|uniref:Uncharacterized protein n=1 Tax=Coleophoma cylindrospora TaxID=1849047 RepID=A0A3D8Q732_9HELO|nr:hypothetical protein BP6252_13691 [Coleophoma cylindrospora]
MVATTVGSRAQVLQASAVQTEAVLRPVITYINGDVAWLVSFPRPTSDKSVGGKVYYHAVIDPWFGQPSLVVTSFLLEMKLGRDAGLFSRAAIDAAIVEIELAAGNSLDPTDADPAVDAVFVTGMAEHCHKESLLQFSISTPVFAVAAAASTIGPWGHFDTVVTMLSCDPSKTPWKEGHPGSPLPAWLTAFPPTVTRINNFGLALVTSVNDSVNELILMAPHGISADETSIKGFATTVKMLALVAPLKDSYVFGVQAVLGVKDGLAIGQAAGMQYYVRSGDFVSLKYRGLISWFLSDVPRDLEWGADELKKQLGAAKADKQPTLVEVENGGSYVLV